MGLLSQGQTLVEDGVWAWILPPASHSCDAVTAALNSISLIFIHPDFINPIPM